MASDPDWVVVDTVVDMQGFSSSRPPQRNTENMPSKQFADAAAERCGLALRLAEYMNPNRDPGYDPRTKTAPTVETLTTDDTLNENPNVDGAGNPRPSRRPALYAAPASGFRLTKTTLKQHQQQLDALSPGDLHRWLDAAAPGFTRHNAIVSGESGSYLAVRSKQSHATDGSFEMIIHPDTVDSATNDIRATGSLFDETSCSPSVYHQYLEVD